MAARIVFVWEFVERFYPDYSSSDEIAHEGDLAKLLENEYEPGDCADDLLKREYNGDINDPQIRIDHNQILVEIYETAIEAYLKAERADEND